MEMPEEKKKQLLQKCSRHRTKYEPPPSPLNPWLLDLQEDGPEDQTQPGSPLKTRRYRRQRHAEGQVDPKVDEQKIGFWFCIPQILKN
jgi:hypothetical protein